MFNKLYPGAHADSVESIDFESLFAKGKKGIIFDIDNTLVPHGAPATKEAIAFFERLRSLGFDTVLLSNNRKKRVESFAKEVGSKFIYLANKPSKKGYLKAMELMGTEISETVFVGDQLFTDVWGANRCGMDSILTKPINPKEEIQIVLKRRLEAIVLHFEPKRK